MDNAASLPGSEAARGVPKLRIPRPAFADGSVDEFASVLDGITIGRIAHQLRLSKAK